MNGEKGPEVPVLADLRITLYQDGRLQFKSTVTDKIMLYGLLELTKDAIKIGQKPEIIPFPGGVIPDRVLKGGP